MKKLTSILVLLALSGCPSVESFPRCADKPDLEDPVITTAKCAALVYGFDPTTCGEISPSNDAVKHNPFVKWGICEGGAILVDDKNNVVEAGTVIGTIDPSSVCNEDVVEKVCLNQ